MAANGSARLGINFLAGMPPYPHQRGSKAHDRGKQARYHSHAKTSFKIEFLEDCGCSSGDLSVILAEGFFIYLSRRKRSIQLGGHPVSVCGTGMAV